MAKQPFNAKPVAATPTPTGTMTMPKPVPAQNSGFEMKPVSQDAIRRRAYEIFLARSAKGQQGNAASDWLQAERELSAKR